MPIYREMKKARPEAFEVGCRCYRLPEHAGDVHALDARYAVLSHIHQQICEGAYVCCDPTKRDIACDVLQRQMRNVRKIFYQQPVPPDLHSARFSPLLWDLQRLQCGAIVYDMCRIFDNRCVGDVANEIRHAFGRAEAAVCDDPFLVVFPNIIEMLEIMTCDATLTEGTRKHLRAQIDARCALKDMHCPERA